MDDIAALAVDLGNLNLDELEIYKQALADLPGDDACAIILLLTRLTDVRESLFNCEETIRDLDDYRFDDPVSAGAES